MEKTMEIPLTRGQVAIIDVDDWHLIKDYKWHAQWSTSKNGYYAGTNMPNGKGRYSGVGMHRFIMNAKKGEVVDHIDGHGLNNRKDNLRIVSARENAMNKGISIRNTSTVTGVTFEKGCKKWRARIGFDKKLIDLGCFYNFDDAVEARRKAEDKYYGEFARRTEPVIEEYVAPKKERETFSNLWYMFGYGEVYCISLSHEQYSIIDICDYEKIRKYTWSYATSNYAIGYVNGASISMHRYIKSAPNNKVVDHINGDGLDNRRCNLRLASAVENAWNTKARSSSRTGYKNISLIKNQWAVIMMIGSIQTYLGRFPTLEEALDVRNAAYREHRGEFARYD